MYDNDNNDDNNDGNEFQFPPEWEGVAHSRDPLKMANTLYDNLKKQKHSGIIPHPDTIKYIIHTLKGILYREYEWDVEQLEELEEKFKELNKYYPTSQPPGTKEVTLPYPPMLGNILRKNELSDIFLGLVPIGNIQNLPPNEKHFNFFPGKKENNLVEVTEINRENNLEKNNKWKITKNIIKVVFKVAIYWLALIGIITLLGV